MKKVMEVFECDRCKKIFRDPCSLRVVHKSILGQSYYFCADCFQAEIRVLVDSLIDMERTLNEPMNEVTALFHHLLKGRKNWMKYSLDLLEADEEDDEDIGEDAVEIEEEEITGYPSYSKRATNSV